MDGNTSQKIMILGGGRMGTALGKGFALSGVPKAHIYFTQRNPSKREQLEKEGFSIVQPMQKRIDCTVVIVAVKPKDVPAALADIPLLVSPKTAVVSVAATVTLKDLQTLLPNYPVFRIRPSILVEIRKGNLLLAVESQSIWASTYEHVVQVFSQIGSVFPFPEKMTAALTWDSSSVPIVLIAKILAARLQDFQTEKEQDQVAELLLCGLENTCAYLRAAQKQGVQLSTASQQLQDKVISKGGLNDAAFQYLDESVFFNLLQQASKVYKSKE